MTRWIILGVAVNLVLVARAISAWGGELHTAEISLVDGVARGEALSAPSGRAPTLVLAQGDTIELRWTSDRDMVLHLHGYDIEAHVGPERNAAMAFEARAAGRFPVETHDADGRHRVVLYIEMHPK